MMQIPALGLFPQFPELRRSFSNEFFELFVKMTQVIESTIVADIHDVLICIYEQLAGVIDFNFVQVFENCKSGGGFEKAAYRCGGHMDNIGHLLQVNLALVVFHQELMDADDAGIFGLKLCFYVVGTGQVSEGFTAADEIHNLVKKHQALHAVHVGQLKHDPADFIQGFPGNADPPF